MASENVNRKLAELSGGEFADFNDFYAKLASPLRAHLYRMCPTACDDLVQEAFVKAWHALPTFRGEASLKNWMYRIATHVAIDFIRKKSPLAASVELGFEAAATEAGPDARHAYRDLAEKAVQKLDPLHRAAFVLYVFDELSLQEIAKVLEIPEGTVKSRLAKARQILSAYLKKEGIAYE